MEKTTESTKLIWKSEKKFKKKKQQHIFTIQWNDIGWKCVCVQLVLNNSSLKPLSIHHHIIYYYHSLLGPVLGGHRHGMELQWHCPLSTLILRLFNFIEEKNKIDVTQAHATQRNHNMAQLQFRRNREEQKKKKLRKTWSDFSLFSYGRRTEKKAIEWCPIWE